MAPSEHRQVAVAAARAMGVIGSPEALKLLKKARQRSNPATDKAIDDAMVDRNDHCETREDR